MPLYTENQTTNKKEILIIDDDYHSNLLYNEIFLYSNVKVTIIDSGEKGITQINKKNDYDLIILDIKLPHMNGIDILCWLRKQGIKTPVIISTAFVTMDIRNECINREADEFITKPLDIDYFSQLIEKYLPGFLEKKLN